MKTLQQIKTAIFAQYEVRKTDAQKTAFIQWMRDYAQRLGMDMQVEESGRFIRTRNLIFGDLSSAKTLITAHYDTCARLPFPNFMTPCSLPVILMTQGLIPMMLFFALGLAAGFLGATVFPLVMPESVATAAIAFLSMAMIYAAIALMIFGPQNPHTANDNTSGVVAVLRLLPDYLGRKDVAFVLFDNEEKGLLGSSAFVKAHPQMKKQAFVVNLDCVSDGDTLLYAYSKAAKHCPQVDRLLASLEKNAPEYGKQARSGQTPKVIYPSDQAVFSCGTAFAALKGKKLLYLDRIHTAKDTIFDESNLLCLCHVIREAI